MSTEQKDTWADHVDRIKDVVNKDSTEPTLSPPTIVDKSEESALTIPGLVENHDEVPLLEETPESSVIKPEEVKITQDTKELLPTPVVKDVPAAVEMTNATPTDKETKVDTWVAPEPLAPLVDKFPLTDQHLPEVITQRLSYVSLNQKISDFQSTTLLELIRKNTNTRFLAHGTKYCYRLDYKSLTLTHAEAVDNYSDSMVSGYGSSYVKQHMNSISGEHGDLCYYTYTPSQLRQFLDINKNNKYTYLPVTVYATDSANGKRHDMLLIFDNKAKLFYWFDCRNREDYLPVSKDLPKNAIDILFVLFGNAINLGYVYEPSPSWMIQGTLHSYGSVGDFDFLVATAWCYNMLITLGYYDSPTAYMSVLDNLPESDRFHLAYVTMLDMISAEYRKYVPYASQVDLTKQAVKPVDHINSGVTPMRPIQTRAVPTTVVEHKDDTGGRKRTIVQPNGSHLTHRTTTGGAVVQSSKPLTTSSQWKDDTVDQRTQPAQTTSTTTNAKSCIIS